MKDRKGKLLSPCIVSKAKFALGLENWYTGNDKTCSPEYWIKVLTLIAQQSRIKISKNRFLQAIRMKKLYSN